MLLLWWNHVHVGCEHPRLRYNIRFDNDEGNRMLMYGDADKNVVLISVKNMPTFIQNNAFSFIN